MELITNTQDESPKQNTVVGMPELENSTICFKGKNNILYCEENVSIVNSRINFEGDNSIVFLSSNCHQYYLGISLYHNSVCYFGRDNYINGKLNIVLSEQKHFMVGNDGLFSFDCWVRTADPHLIYDGETGKRINQSKSVFLGDHVWIGQHAFLLKGTYIGSGSIIGAQALVSGKTIESNTCYGGNPAKKIASNVFFTKDCVHKYKKKQTKAHSRFTGKDFIYSSDDKMPLSFWEIEKLLNGLSSSQERLEVLREHLCFKQDKNRFFVQSPTKYNKLITKIRTRGKRK